MSNKTQLSNNVSHTMSSREIAEVTGKRHRDVLRDIRWMLTELNERNFAPVEYMDAKGQRRPEYLLGEDHLLTLVTGYDVMMRHAIMKRWKALEKGEVKPYHQRLSVNPGRRCIEIGRPLTLHGKYVRFYKRLKLDNNASNIKAMQQVKKETGYDLAEITDIPTVALEALHNAEAGRVS